MNYEKFEGFSLINLISLQFRSRKMHSTMCVTLRSDPRVNISSHYRLYVQCVPFLSGHFLLRDPQCNLCRPKPPGCQRVEKCRISARPVPGPRAGRPSCRHAGPADWRAAAPLDRDWLYGRVIHPFGVPLNCRAQVARSWESSGEYRWTWHGPTAAYDEWRGSGTNTVMCICNECLHVTLIFGLKFSALNQNKLTWTLRMIIVITMDIWVEQTEIASLFVYFYKPRYYPPSPIVTGMFLNMKLI